MGFAACSWCHGIGSMPNRATGEERPCGRCGGTGYVDACPEMFSSLRPKADAAFVRDVLSAGEAPTGPLHPPRGHPGEKGGEG